MNAAVEAAIKLLQDQDYIVIPKERLLIMQMSSLVDKSNQTVFPFDKGLELAKHQHATALAVEILRRSDLTLEVTTATDDSVRLTTKLGFIKPKKETYGHSE